MLVDQRTIMVASTKFQFEYGKASPRMSTLSLTEVDFTIIHGKNDELYSSKLISKITRLSTLHAVSTKVLLDEMVRNEYAAYSLSLSLSLSVCVCVRARANYVELENDIISY